jgi:hypothetical protein
MKINNQPILYLLLSAFVLWMLEEIFIRRPEFFFISLSLGALVIIGMAKYLSRNEKGAWLSWSLPPLLLFLAGSFYAAIIVSLPLIQTIFAFSAVFFFFYFRTLAAWPAGPERGFHLRRLIQVESFLACFAFAATIYSLPAFLSWPFFYLLLLFVVVAAALFGQFFFFLDRGRQEERSFFFVNVLVLSEIVGVLYLLPLDFNILGLFAAIAFYILVIFTDWRRQGRLNWRHLRWPFFIGAGIAALVLLTSRWR